MEFAVEKIIIADDHPMFRSALQQSIVTDHRHCQIIECESLDSLRQQVREHADADLLILDLHMPGVEGFSSLAYMQKQCPSLPIIMISANDKPDIIRQAKGFGALGFIGKSASIEVIREAIAAVLRGDTYFPDNLDAADETDDEAGLMELTRCVAELTPQQFNVLQLIKQGLLNKQIAFDLNISEATVKAHVTAIMRKLGVRNRTQAVMKVSRLKLEDRDNEAGSQRS